MGTPRKSGTRRDNLESARKQLVKFGRPTDHLDAQLKAPPLSPGTDYLLGHFNRVNRSRAQGMNGPLPTSFTELKAFCELMDISLDPWEVETLQAMDAAYLEATYEVIGESS